MPPVDFPVYIGFGSLSEAQKMFVSSLRRGSQNTIFYALIWSNLQAYFSSKDPWENYLFPKATLEHHMIIYTEIKGSTPCPLFMDPSPRLWHLEDSTRPSNDPSTSWSHHFGSLWIAFSSHYELLHGIVTKDLLFAHYFIIVGAFRIIRIRKKII